MKKEPFKQRFRPGLHGLWPLLVRPCPCTWCRRPATSTETLTWSNDYLREGESVYYWCDACLPTRQAQGCEWPQKPQEEAP
jgi:hypothetical protein